VRRVLAVGVALGLLTSAALLATRSGSASPATRSGNTAPAARAASAATSELTFTMDDGVTLAATLHTPPGTPPAAGWPGVVVLHGLGGTRGSVASIADTFAAAGYAALAYDARGHGVSGGNVELASAREVADLRAVRAALARRGDVSDTAIGAWGISYGGGQVWNALAAGVPFAAAAVVQTWTDLYSALWPQGVARSALVFGFATAIRARSPVVAGIERNALTSRNLAQLRALAAERSSLPRLGGMRTPVYMFQGRQDFAFDITQATAAFRRLAGPKKLYVGAFGHTPSTFPGPDVAYVLAEGVRWFDRFLKNVANAVDQPRNIAIAPDGGTGPRLTVSAVPTRVQTYALPGTQNARGSALVTRRTRRLAAPLETWGGGTVQVRVRRLARYPRLVVTVRAGNKVLTHGALKPRRGLNTVRLANYCVYAPRGARLSVSVGPASPHGVLAYLDFEDAGSVTVGPMTLKLGVLRRPVTR
jgi:fermentation-respiration switch protein FrsA (DUF1100 family)